MAELDRKQRDRLRRVERILSNYERERDRLEEKILHLRRERQALSGSGFPLMTLASSLLSAGGGSAVAKAAKDIMGGNSGRWTSQLVKFERELRRIQQKSEEVSSFVKDIQTTLDIVLSGIGLVTGSGGGKIIEGLLGDGDKGEEEKGPDKALTNPGEDDSKGGGEGALGDLKLPPLNGLNMGTLMEIANSPQFKALSREIIQKLAK